MLHSIHAVPFAVLWLAWLAYWFAAAGNVKVTRRREPLWTRLAQLVLLAIGAALLAFPHQPVHGLSDRFLPWTMVTYWLGLIMVAVGLAFAVWARICLGRNWSSAVTLKQDHELIRSGPYRLVRHPIYSGMLLAIFGTAFAFGEWRGLLAFAAIAASLCFKLTLEERFMNEAFPEQYARYRAAVPALIPFLAHARRRRRASD